MGRVSGHRGSPCCAPDEREERETRDNRSVRAGAPFPNGNDFVRPRGRLTSLVPVLVALLAMLTVACSDAKSPAVGGVLPARTVDARSVQVTITPTRFDARGATFAIVLDTHVVELSTDLAASAMLEVDGRTWPVVGWSGDGLGGHHRGGELRFDPGGATRGTARLTIAGFPEPVAVTWDLPG